MTGTFPVVTAVTFDADGLVLTAKLEWWVFVDGVLVEVRD